MSDSPEIQLPEFPSETPTAEELDKHFSALDDSVGVIEDKIANGPSEFQTQEEADEEIERNVAHIGIMLSKSFIKDSGRDLSAYEATQPAS
jgi:hypothetical protein